MRVLITGATGFIGRALVLRLRRDGHELTAWVRDVDRAADQVGPDVARISGAEALTRAVAEADAIINLAGEPIVDRAWTPARRAALIASRVDTTRALVAAIATRRAPLPVLISASAIGYYGMGDHEVDEGAPAGHDFAADLCAQWEAAAEAARPHVERLVIVRIGIVLGNGGGALAAMLPPFRAGAGGPLGDGAQWVSWIHLDDLLEVLALALTRRDLRGVINAVAPTPVTNRALTATLGRALRRPTWLPVPAFALRLALGARADLVLRGQHVRSRALADAGFAFRFPTLDAALDDLLVPPAITIRRVRRDEVPDHPYLRARPPSHVLVMHTEIAAPLDEVFPFFAAAENLALITPPDMGFRIRSPRPIAMGTGAVIDYRVRVMGVPLRWRTVIERWQPGQLFVDSQHRGPYRSWFHEHHFTASGSRTLMEDRVYFAAPLGPLGRAVSRLLIASELRRIFGYRAAAIRRRFGARVDERVDAAGAQPRRADGRR